MGISCDRTVVGTGRDVCTFGLTLTRGRRNAIFCFNDSNNIEMNRGRMKKTSYSNDCDDK